MSQQVAVEVIEAPPVSVKVIEEGGVLVVEVIHPGPQGPPGESSTDGSHIHQQPTASSTWIINHNLGFRPAVEVYNTGSQEIEADIVHTSVNQTVVSFTTAIAGYARLN